MIKSTQRQPIATQRIAMMEVSQGFPQAIEVCNRILQIGDEIDPLAPNGGGQNCLLQMEQLRIRGMRLYKLWHNVCHRSTPQLVALTRAYQLRIRGVSAKVINEAIDNPKRTLDLESIMKSVRKEVPDFNQPRQSHLFNSN